MRTSKLFYNSIQDSLSNLFLDFRGIRQWYNSLLQARVLLFGSLKDINRRELNYILQSTNVRVLEMHLVVKLEKDDIRSITSFNSIEKLNLCYNSVIKEVELIILLASKTLRELRLSHCGINNINLKEQNTCLILLDVSFNLITNQSLLSLTSNLLALCTLEIRGCTELTSSVLPFISNSSITTLDLRAIYFGISHDREIKNFLLSTNLLKISFFIKDFIIVTQDIENKIKIIVEDMAITKRETAKISQYKS